MSGDSERRPGARAEQVARILGLVYALASLAAMWWVLTPEHQRRLVLMRAVKWTENQCGRLACRSGREAMGHELAGCGRNYGVPYVFSVARDWAAAMYDRLRYSA